MASIDIFNSTAFSLTGLSAAIETAPYKPRLLGELGLFDQKSSRTTTVYVEKKHNRLSILNTANRGTVKDVHSTVPRDAFPFKVPHVPYFQNILADDIQNMRAFGSETELEMMGKYVNEQLIGMKCDHDVTHEWHRVGALKGIVYDGDGTSVIYNFFTQFGLTQTVVNFYANNASFATTCTNIIRTIADKLGDESFDGIIALCGNTYFDQVVKHPSMVAAYDRWRDGEFRRYSHLGPSWYSAATNGFEYQNILFVNYRGNIGGLSFIPDTEAYFVPRGVPGILTETAAPADFMETVNTMGQKFYAKQRIIAFDKGVELHTQSNVLAMCSRPDVIVKSVFAGCTDPSSSSC